VTLPRDVRRRTGAPGRDAALVEAVLDAVPFPTVLLDPDGLMLLGNHAWTERARAVHGDRFEVGVGKSYYDQSIGVRDDENSRALMECLRELARGERTEVSLDYSVSVGAGTDLLRWYHIHASRVDEAGHVAVTHVDISSRVAAEQAARWRAGHDHLTELPNRAHLLELIEAELRRPAAAPVALLFLDVDGFKDVNDSLGHDAGDALLRQLAVRLVDRTRAGDTVGRLAGDEFVVLGRDCDIAGAQALAERFRDVFDLPFHLDGRVARLSVSIGIATAEGDRHEVRASDLVRDADLAMYAAKAAGRGGIQVFEPAMRSAVQQKVQLAAELRDAIAGDQLVLHYQPVMHLPTGRCTGAEALVRWQHPERGLLYPGDFLPVAEEAQLMVPLARWVLGEATRQTAAWRAAGLDFVTGVNINAAHFGSGTLVDDVMTALDAAGLPPENLVIELTETSVAHEPDRAAEQFAELRRRGVEVSIDDFGSGFSSLGQLVTIPTGILKIDRSLVAFPEGRRQQAAATIAAVVALGQACGIRSLAEGVETAEQLELANELGCTFAQGYHIARPMPGDRIMPWIAAREAERQDARA
jgi:diguanylate cyclase (GGDEF)-like protein